MDADLGLLVLRLMVGLYLAGHGAQKLFGWFEGNGLAGTTAWLGSMGLRPALFWTVMAGLSELGGGMLLALGLLSPLGSVGIIASMLMAIIKVHWPNGFWVDNNGMELPLTNIAAALALALNGPGRYALDPVLGIALPVPLMLIGGLVLVVLSVGVALLTQARQPVLASHAEHSSEGSVHHWPS